MKLIVGLVILSVLMIIAFAIRHKHKSFSDSFKEAGSKSNLISAIVVILFILVALFNNRERLMK